MNNKLEKLLLSMSAYVSSIGVYALVLTMFGAYGIFGLTIFPILIAVVAISYFYFSEIPLSKVLRVESIKFGYEGFTLSILLIVIGYLYFFFPTESVLGGRDPGVYVLSGVYISKTGGLFLNDPTYSKLMPILGDSIRTGYPGVYSNYALGLSEDPASLSAQFYHLFPAYLAIGYDLFGMDGLLRTNGVFGLLSLLLIFVLVRKIIGPVGALVSVLLCGINPAQLWNIRITLSEPLSQFLILFFLFAVEKTIYKKKNYPFVICGLLLGINSLNRIDSWILVPALSLFYFYISIFAQRYLRKAILMFNAFVLTSFAALVYGAFYSRTYVIGVWEEGSLPKITVVVLASFLFTYSLWAALGYGAVRKKIGSAKAFILNNKTRFSIFLYVLFFISLGYAYYLRPLSYPEGWAGVARAAFASKSFPIFLWYVPFPIFAFLIFGYTRLLFRSKRIGFAPLVSIGSMLLLGYLYDPSISPDHFWASRRWVLFSIPFVLVVGTIGIFSVHIYRNQLTNIIRVSLFLFCVSYLLWRSKLFIREKVLGGFAEGLFTVSQYLPDGDAIYFTADESLASPLKYIYGKRVYLVENTQGFLSRLTPLLDNGSEIYFIQSTDYFGKHPDLNFELVSEIKLSAPYPIVTKERFPDAMSRVSLNQQVFRIRKNLSKKAPGSGSSYEWKMGEGGFQTHSGEFGKNLEILATRKEGSLVYGPYLTLPKGEYEIIFEGKALEKAMFLISADKGSTILVDSTGGNETGFKKIHFNIPTSEMKNVEFKVNVPGKSNVIVSKLKLKRIGD